MECPLPIFSIVKSKILWCPKSKKGWPKDGWTGLWLKHTIEL